MRENEKGHGAGVGGGEHAAIRSHTRTRLSVDTRRHTHTGHGTNPRRWADDMPQGLQQSHRAPHLPTRTHARAHTHTLPNLVLLTRTNEARPPPHLSQHPRPSHRHVPHPSAPRPTGTCPPPLGGLLPLLHPCAAPTSQETLLKFHLLQRFPDCNPAPCSTRPSLQGAGVSSTSRPEALSAHCPPTPRVPHPLGRASPERTGTQSKPSMAQPRGRHGSTGLLRRMSSSPSPRSCTRLQAHARTLVTPLAGDRLPAGEGVSLLLQGVQT